MPHRASSHRGTQIPPVVLLLHGTIVGRDYLPEASPGSEPGSLARQRWHATATPLNQLYARGWMEHPQNVPHCSLCHIRSILKISCRLVPPFSCNVANRRTDKHTNQQRWKHNIRRSANGNNTTNVLQFMEKHCTLFSLRCVLLCPC